MQKLLLTISAVFSVLFASGQYLQPIQKYGPGTMPKNENGEVVFSKVIQVEGISKDEIYQSAKVFMVDLFNSPNNTISLDDPQRGIIIAKGCSERTTSNGVAQVPRTVYFSIKIQARDGRYKVEVYDLRAEFIYQGMKREKYAEDCTDEKCLNDEGRVRGNGIGIERRTIQDCAYLLMKSVESSIQPIAEDTEDW